MIQNKDASFKFISKEHLRELFDILGFRLDMDIDPSEVEVLSTEEVVIEPSLIRPDYVVKVGHIIFMMEFESSHVGIGKKKLFKLYVSAYDYKNNNENNKIIFFVVSAKENSKMAEYKINDWDSFKFPIISLKDLNKEKILHNVESKIENKEDFTNKELIELALTPILEKDKESIIRQFYETKDIMSKVSFPDDEIKTSVYGIILMLSSMYFEELDPIRKNIQGDLMGKVDCVKEACEESFNDGVSKGFSDGVLESSLRAARNLLEVGKLSLEEISRCTDLPLEEVRQLADSLET